MRPKRTPPLAILMDLLMLLMVMMILSSEKDVYEITFEDNRLPQGSLLTFKAGDGGRMAREQDGRWVPIGRDRLAGAVYVGCPFCDGMTAPLGLVSVHYEVALLGVTAARLRDLVFDQCAARQKCRPLRVRLKRDGDVELAGLAE